MNAVLGMAEMALREEMSEAARNYIYQIKASGKNLLVIINDILDFSKIESGKMEIVNVTYEPLSMINDISSIICNRIGDKEVDLIMDVSPDIPSKLLGDSVRIQQIIINLLNNAVKFTKRGHVKLKLISERTGESDILLKGEVTDTGCGIKQEDMGKLFGSFQQLDSRRNRNIEGTGLGLTITKRLLELMGGKISVASVYEEGTTFSFEIPQKVVSNIPLMTDELSEEISVALYMRSGAAKDQVISDLKRLNAKIEDAVQSETLIDESGLQTDFLIVDRVYYSETINKYFLGSKKGKCIVIDGFDANEDIVNPNVRCIRKPVYFLNLYSALGLVSEYVRGAVDDKEDFMFTAPEANVLIVDDNPVNLTVATGLLKPLKMNIDTADCALTAIEKIKEKSYDIVFMDHMMPEVDGVQTTHIIRRMIPTYDDVPIIALTANAVDGAREMFLEEGMNDFVAKPIDFANITAKIRKWLPLEKVHPVDKNDESDKIAEEELPEIEGLNVRAAVKLLGSVGLYMTVLKDYYIAINKKSALMASLYEQKDWRKYTIEVHSLKSTSRQIGADTLSVMAFELEMAGNNENYDHIHEKHGEMMALYAELEKTLAPIFPDAIQRSERKEATHAETIELLKELTEALENFDTLMIDEVIEKMENFTYGEHENIFESLKEAAEMSDIDSCMKYTMYWKKDIAELYTY